LAQRPKIDGRLDDEAWRDVQPLTEFYQCIWKRSAYPIEGRAEIYLGYRGTSLFVAVRGYEPTTDNLTAAATQRDDRNIHRDDFGLLVFD
jgi:hypothetical protein